MEKVQPHSAPAQDPWQGSAAMVCGILVLFSFAIGAAMGAYPGGTFADPTRVGYDFWHNFWCDALRDPALNGLENTRGARMASIAMWVLSAGLLPFWGMAAELCVPTPQFPESNARPAIRWLGTAAMLGLMAVTLLPSNHYPFLHGFLVMVAGPMGVLAAWIAVAKGRASERVPGLASLLGTVALLLTIVNLAQYAREFWLDAPASPLLAGVQKLATLFFLAWVLSLSAVVLSGRRSRAR